MMEELRRAPLQPEMEKDLPKRLERELKEFKNRQNMDFPEELEADAHSLDQMILEYEYHGKISCDQAYYLRLRYLGYKRQAAEIVKRQQQRRDEGIVEIWAGENQIAMIPSTYRVEPRDSTYTFYVITPPWYHKSRSMDSQSLTDRLAQIASLPQDWRVWKCGKKEFLCIRFNRPKEKRIKTRYLPVTTRPALPEDRYLP